MIGVINYGMGNVGSVVKALDYLGIDNILGETPEDFVNVEKIILPGVGAFRDVMNNLISRGWVDFLNEKVIKEGIPYLGICLGLQLIFEESEEFGITKGFGWFKGNVKGFSLPKEYKIPHMGWNQLWIKQEHPLFSDLEDGSYFYFVHSFFVNPDNDSDVIGKTDYGIEFSSAVAKDNIVATQFHPEKSGRLGLKVLENFNRWSGAWK